MDTMQAAMMAEVHKDDRIRVFDWDKAAAILANGRVQDAEAGLENDLEWTGGKILRDGRPLTSREDTYTYLASNWATPLLIITGETSLPCWRYQDESPGWEAETLWPDSALAVLRGDEPKAITDGSED